MALSHRLPVRSAIALLSALMLTVVTVPAATASHGDPGEPGDATIALHINDSAAGGTYVQEFKRVYADETADGTPVYIYVPIQWESGVVEGVESLDPDFDHNPDDEFEPCANNEDSSFAITQEQFNYLGDELTNQIVRVDEAHYGSMGDASPGTEGDQGDALVTLVYNVQDDSYYDCGVTSYRPATSRPTTSRTPG